MDYIYFKLIWLSDTFWGVQKDLAMGMSETDRVKAVQALQIMGSVAEPEFDRLARLAGHVAHADYAHICFIDDAHQFAKAMNGVELPQLMSREQSICIEAVDTDAPVLIENLATDPRPKCQNFCRQYGFHSYVGVPIRLVDGCVVGAIAAVSFESGLLSQRRLAALQECADLVTRELLIRQAAGEEVRRAPIVVARQAAATPDLVRAIMRNHLNVLKSVSDGVIVVRGDGVISFVNPAAEQMLGRPAASMLGSSFAKKLNVSMTGAALPEKDCPVAASLRDGNERLAKRAYFLGVGCSAVKVDCAISPVNANAYTIGAVVVFRRIMGPAASHGLELRNTLREVSKLKEQIARLEAAQARAEVSAGIDLPDLRSGKATDLKDLLQIMREEQASQIMRVQALNGGSGDGSTGAAAPRGARSDLLGSGETQGRALSRTERWLEC